MFDAVKYIKSLEAVGFRRNQAEAQVQMFVDTIEGELVKKEDLALLEQKIDHRFTQSEYRVVTKVGIIVVTSITLAVALMTWLMKLH